MNNKSSFNLIVFLFAMLIGSALLYLIQTLINNDQLAFLMNKTAKVTVVGSAQKTLSNQTAEFTAGIEVIADEKADATTQATEIMDEVLNAIYELDIESQDIQTTQVSVYQEDEYIELQNEGSINSQGEELLMIYPPRSSQKGNWRANISTTVTLRSEDPDQLKNKSERLLAIFNSSGVNYTYGPHFRFDEEFFNESELINEAVADARKKAEAIALNSGQKVAKILEVVEDQVGPRPFYMDSTTMSGREDTVISDSLEPGSSVFSKTVTVTFQLR